MNTEQHVRTNELFRLDGEVAIVTGGSGLYGQHISRALCEAGAKVVIASRSREKCEELAKKLRHDGLHAIALTLDLEDEGSIVQLRDQVISEYGRLDILINNSVSRFGLADLEQTNKDDWESAERVNGTGLMLMTQAAIIPMKQQMKGAIINISSIQGVVGPHFPVYGETGMSSGIEYTYSKWGMVGFTKWIANYYGKYNIRANCISPGGYNPALMQDTEKDEFVQNYKRLTPLGRFASDHDIKGPIVFLASQAAQYITGHNLVMDGGWTSW
jgi:NAD(P)-dependent dehydrogenase (short-subunit alcohol dehydrogenase family)